MSSQNKNQARKHKRRQQKSAKQKVQNTVEDEKQVSFIEQVRQTVDKFAGFQTLNKPSECALVYSDAPGPSDIGDCTFEHIYQSFDPPMPDWKGMSKENQVILDSLYRQLEDEFKQQQDILFRGAHDEYLASVLLCHVYNRIAGPMGKGGCREITFCVTFALLPQFAKQHSFELIEVKGQDSTLHPQRTHTFGVIDRARLNIRNPEQGLSDPSTWGDAAIVYDPWNRLDVFPAAEMKTRSLYAKGKWQQWKRLAWLYHSDLRSRFKRFIRQLLENPTDPLTQPFACEP